MIEASKWLKHGKTQPLLLSPVQHYRLFAVLCACNVAVLVVLVSGAARNEGALKAIAKAAEVAYLRQDGMPRPEPCRPEASRPRADDSPAEAPNGRYTETETSFRVSVPVGWQWRGCHVESNSVEVLLAPR